MKVLHVIPSLSPLRGGPSFAIIEMVKSLYNRGIDVEIVTTDDNADSVLRVPKKVTTFWKGIRVIFFPRLNLPLKFAREFSISHSFTRWIQNKINDYDLVHTHAVFSFLPSYARYVCKKNKIPCVARTMGHLDEWSLTKSSIRKKIFLDLWEKKNLLSAKLIHTTSCSEAANVRKVLGGDIKIEIIPLGINLPDGCDLSKTDARRLLGIKEDCKVIVFQSRIHPKKRLELILKAISELSYPLLAIAGSGDKAYIENLKKYAKSLGIEKNIIWLGWLDGVKRGAILKAGDLFVLPSSSENFGLAAVEAAACGTPVLLSENVDVGVKLKELGAAVISKDHEYSSVINNILKKPGDYLFDAKSVIDEFNWSKIAEKISKAYLRILRK
jgi:glycosyltransferase involved in cell wall biosynthesis